MASDPDFRLLAADDSLILRIFAAGGPYPATWNQFRFFGPPNSRFDHHPPPARVHEDRGILYGALALETCIAEYFQRGRTVHRRHAPRLAAFSPTRDLRLLDLTGAWPTRIGGSMKINSGRRDAARFWSQRFYETFQQVDGVYCASSMHANRPAVALYERALDALPVAPDLDMPLDDASLLGDVKRAAKTLGYAIEPTF